MATNQPVEFFSPADISAAQDYGQQLRENPQSAMPPLAGWGQKSEAQAKDYVLSTLMGLRNSVQAAQEGARLGDPVLASLSALGSAGRTPSPQAIAQARDAAQARAQLEALQTLPIEKLSPTLVQAHPELKGLPLAVVHQIAPILEKLNAQNDTHYNLDQAAALMSPDQTPEAIAKTKAGLAKLYPQGNVPKDYAHVAATNSRFSGTFAEKQDQFDQKQWVAMNHDANPDVAGPRKLVGMAGVLNKKITSALGQLKGNPTNQQLNGAIAEIANVLNNGAADDHAIKAQTYDTLQGRLNDLSTLVRSAPTENAPKAVVDKVRETLQELAGTNNDVITRNLNTLETVYGDTINRNEVNRQRFEQFKKNVGASLIGPEGGRGGMQIVSSQAEYDALPKGSQYVGPDGVTRTKR